MGHEAHCPECTATISYCHLAGSTLSLVRSISHAIVAFIKICCIVVVCCQLFSLFVIHSKINAPKPELPCCRILAQLVPLYNYLTPTIPVLHNKLTTRQHNKYMLRVPNSYDM